MNRVPLGPSPLSVSAAVRHTLELPVQTASKRQIDSFGKLPNWRGFPRLRVGLSRELRAWSGSGVSSAVVGGL